MIRRSLRGREAKAHLIASILLTCAALMVVATTGCVEQIRSSMDSSSRAESSFQEHRDPQQTADPNVAGFAIGLYYERDGADYEALVWEAARSGARAINVIVMREQNNVADSEIRISERYTPADKDVRRTIQYAVSLGLDVTVMPVVFVKRRAAGLWRGTLRPDDPDAWWRSYQNFVLHYADLTADLEIGWFVVGSELGSMEDEIVPWANLIREVRARIGAKLTYSANWDRFERVAFWNRLDAIGISLYEPIGGESSDEWRVSMMRARERIEVQAERLGAPVLITEFGFPSRPSAQQRPWDTIGEATVDLAGQDELIRTLLRTWCGSSRIRRIFVWNFAGTGGGTDSDYSPRHKPALSVLDSWNRCREGAQ